MIEATSEWTGLIETTTLGGSARAVVAESSIADAKSAGAISSLGDAGREKTGRIRDEGEFWDIGGSCLVNQRNVITSIALCYNVWHSDWQHQRRNFSMLNIHPS